MSERILEEHYAGHHQVTPCESCGLCHPLPGRPAVPPSDAVPAGNPLTLEMLQRAFDKIANAPVRVCGATEPHLVGPHSQGFTGCANCGEVIYVVDTPEGKRVTAPPPEELALAAEGMLALFDWERGRD